MLTEDRLVLMPLFGGTSIISEAGDILELVTRFGAVCTLLSLQSRVNLFDTSVQGTPSRRTAYNIQIQQRVSKIFD